MAKRQTFRIVGAVIALAAVLLVGGVAFALFRPPAQASGAITAIPLEAGSAGSDGAAEAATAAPTTSGVDGTTEATAVSPVGATATSEPEAAGAASDGDSAPTAAATDSAGDSAAATGVSSGPILAQIVPEESEARFIIDEILNGEPKTVVGTTNQVAGEQSIDPSNPAATRVGTIQVNARTFQTDSGMRNRTIANRILQTGQFEFITFEPTSLVGLPDQATMGESYTFQIVGNLTILDVTKEVTFDVTATPISESRLEGSAKATIQYADFGIVIPQVRQVAGVSPDVGLEIDFVAVPK